MNCKLVLSFRSQFIHLAVEVQIKSELLHISRYVTRPIGALTGAVEAVCAATTQTRPTLPASREEQGAQISNEKCQSALTDWHYALAGFSLIARSDRPKTQHTNYAPLSSNSALPAL
ncbi:MULTISPECIES: hypothetical protein [Chromobacterium]|uniref:hypothetical protein n=1 Tax=Chromobacterium TaxID=535 RepID=UPI001889433F|nr:MULTISPECIES: hypothetical protein [Chromobacterium]WON84626.1 hypothetical protein OK026_03675 [Chromobacterium haemolyticum]